MTQGTDLKERETGDAGRGVTWRVVASATALIVVSLGGWLGDKLWERTEKNATTHRTELDDSNREHRMALATSMMHQEEKLEKAVENQTREIDSLSDDVGTVKTDVAHIRGLLDAQAKATGSGLSGLNAAIRSMQSPTTAIAAHPDHREGGG